MATLITTYNGKSVQPQGSNGYPNCSTWFGVYRMKCLIVYSSMTMGIMWNTENGNSHETMDTNVGQYTFGW